LHNLDEFGAYCSKNLHMALNMSKKVNLPNLTEESRNFYFKTAGKKKKFKMYVSETDFLSLRKYPIQN